jgi:hypothetical protein
LNDWYGFEKGNNQYSLEKVFTSSDEPHNQTELAESYGITKQTMNNYMRMASMIPELEDLVDTGIGNRKSKDHNGLLNCKQQINRHHTIIYRRNTLKIHLINANKGQKSPLIRTE